MAKNFANVGKHIDSVLHCTNEGYSPEACATAVGTKEIVKLGCIAGGTSMMSSGVPHVVIGGAGLALSAEPLGNIAKETVLFFSEKDTNKSTSDISSEGLLDDKYEPSDSVKTQIEFMKVRHDIDFTNMSIDTMKEELQKKLDETQEKILFTRDELYEKVSEIHRTSRSSSDVQTRISKLANKLEQKTDILELNYEIMFKKSCALSPEIVSKYKTDSDFKREHDKLNEMMSQNKSVQEIAGQHEKVIQTIKHNNDMTQELNSFTNNLSVCGSVSACVANLCGRPQEAQHINAITSSAVQLSFISAGFSGLGPMACMGPYGLGAMAVVTVLNCAMALSQKTGESPFIALHQMLTSIMTSIADLKKTIEEHFRRLNVKLDKMEANIIKHIIDNFDMNYETQCILRQLCVDTMKFQDYVTITMETINSNINSLKTQLTQQEATKVVIDVGSLISSVYVNLDQSKVSDYTNQLTGKLLHPYEATHIALIGKPNKFDHDSIPSLSLYSLPTRIVYSNIEKYKLLKELIGSNAYVSQFMNSSQIITKMFDVRRNVVDCLCFHTYYNEFLANGSNIGLFPFEFGNSSLILALNKDSMVCNYYYFGDVDFVLDIRFTALLSELGYDIAKQFDATNDEINVLKVLIHLGKQRLTTIVSQEMMDSDTACIRVRLPSLVDTEYENVNHTLYTSIVRALMLLKVNQYTPRSVEDEDYIRISDNEMNQIFCVAHVLQKNIQSVNALKAPHVFNQLWENYTTAKTNLISTIKTEFTAKSETELAKLVDPFINGAFLDITKCENFNEELSVTQNAMNWWNGSKTVANDRGVGAGTWGITTFNACGTFGSYEEAVRLSARNFRAEHLKYIEKCKTYMRQNKLYPKMLSTRYNNVDFKSEYTHQLPFFAYPKSGSGIVLPLFETIRSKLMTATRNFNCFLQCGKYILNGMGHYEAFYQLVNDTFILTLIFKPNADVLSSLNGMTYTDLERTAVNLLTTHKYIALAKYQIDGYSTKFGGVNLDNTKTEALWTWWCGGEAGSGERYQETEHWDSHIRGNWSRAGVSVPTWSTRPSIITKDTVVNILLITDENTSKALIVLERKCDNKLNPMYKQIYTKLFNISTDPVCIELNRYFSTVRAIETYDYFTYKKMENNDIKIRNMTDVTTHILKHYSVWCNTLCDQFSETSKSVIMQTYSTSPFVGDITLTACLKEITQITEIFGAYITKGLSTPDIVKAMIDRINKLYTSHKQLLTDIQRTNTMAPEEQREEINRISRQYSESLNKMGNTSNLLEGSRQNA